MKLHELEDIGSLVLKLAMKHFEKDPKGSTLHLIGRDSGIYVVTAFEHIASNRYHIIYTEAYRNKGKWVAGVGLDQQVIHLLNTEDMDHLIDLEKDGDIWTLAPKWAELRKLGIT